MPSHRLSQALLLLIAIAAVTYLAISLFLPSPRRLIFGIDRQTGEIRLAESGVTFLPPHNYRRISFSKRDGAAQSGGITQTTTKEGIPIKVAYRIRFLISSSQLPDARRIVIDGWDTWFNARVGEAVRAFTTTVPVEELIAPTSRYSVMRERLRQAVADHLGRNGIEVSAFQIESLSVDREALLAHKRQELRRRARAPVGRVAVFGIDGADWDLLNRLILSGRMPNLASILRQGAGGEIRSIPPLVTPLAWASLSTGLPPSRHGIVDFFEQAGQKAPVTARSRNAPAVWEIAPAFGRTTVVVDWWTAWPPLRSEPIIVTPDNLDDVEDRDLAEALTKLNVPPETIGHPQISRFAELSRAELEEALADGSAQEPSVILRDVLSRTWTTHRMGLELFQREQPMLFMLGFPGTDEIHHVFGPFHPPFRRAVDARLRDRYWPVVVNFYIELDRLLGEWVQILPEDTTMMLVSAYGHRWDLERPVTLPFDRSDLASHRDRGVFIAFGNRVNPSQARPSIDLLDIAPTILTLLGLPIAQEMPGDLASGFFHGVSVLDSVMITSYGDVIVLDRFGPSGSLPDPAVYRRELQRIGHLTVDTDSPQRRQPPAAGGENWGRYAWVNNTGARLAQEGKLDEAVDAFENAIRLNPARPAPYLNLAVIALDRQRFTSAEALTWKAIELGAEDPESLALDLAAWYRAHDMPTRAIQFLSDARSRFPDSFAIMAELGSALAAADRYTEALPVLEQALGLQPTSTDVLNHLGTIYAGKKEYGRALDYWNRSLEISPRQPKIAEAARAAVSRL